MHVIVAPCRTERGLVRERRRRRPAHGLAAVAALLGLATLAHAATFVVDTVSDGVDRAPGDGACATVGRTCTLRAAMMEADALAGSDWIQVGAGTYVLGIPGGFEDAAATGDLDITDDLTVTGAGAGLTIIEGGPTHDDRLIDVQGSATVRIEGITLTGRTGRVLDATGGLVVRGGDFLLTDAEIFGLAIPSVGGNHESAISIAGATARIEDTSVHDNAPRRRGAVHSSDATTTIARCRIDHNADQGIEVDGVGRLILSDSLIADNDAATQGWGGGIDYRGQSGLIERCAILRNRANSGGGVNCEGSNLEIRDTTIADNRATFSFGGYGGGITVGSPSAGLTLRGVTITGNYAALEGGGVVLSSTSGFTIGHSIVAGNGTLDLIDYGSFTELTLGHNILGTLRDFVWSGDTSTDLIGVDPLLGPLQDNGGRTPTRMPLAGSPAIDGGDVDCTDSGHPPRTTDQRGTPRPQDGDGLGATLCDVGAVEVAGPCLDCDGDTVLDVNDCAPADPSLSEIPPEPDVRVAKGPAGAAHLYWPPAPPQAGPGLLDDVASDAISAMRVARAANGPCIATDLPAATSFDDARPIAADGWYYLVRTRNTCGPPLTQGWGQDSLGRDRPACP